MISRRGFLGTCGRCAAGLVLGDGLVRAALAVGAGKPGVSAPALEDAVSADPPGLGIEQWSRTVCDLCGLNEPVFIGTRAGKVTAVKGIPRSTIGFGRLCPRARALVAATVTEDRAVKPLLRRDPQTKGTLDGLVAVTWEEALTAATDGLRRVRAQLGPGGIALFASDGETCETYGLIARIARAGLGTDHLDTPARLDALHAYEACRQVFGTPANPGSVEDVDAAGLIFMIGGEVAESHPALFHRVLDARRKGRARVVLLDWRKTEAAAVADLHLRVRPGHELTVVNALAAGLLRGAPASGGALRETGVDPEAVASVRKLWPVDHGVVTLVGPIALGSPAGTMLARAVAHLHRATGQWGEVGRGVLFLPRGANATGVTAFGVAPGMLPAGRHLNHPDDRARIAAAYGVAADQLPGTPGLAALEWPAAVRAGRIGALIVHRANLAAEMPDALAWREALSKSFVVATTTHAPSETTIFADVVLPLAMVSGESTGTMMSLDRRCQTLEQAARPPGEARTADRILVDLGRGLLDPAMFALLAGKEDGSSFAEWDRWRAISAGTSFEATGITVARLSRELGVPWPSAAEDQPGTARLGPAAAAAKPAYVPASAPIGGPRPDSARPLLLVIGPVREHFGSRMRTGRTPELHYEAPSAQLEMHPDDGRDLGIADGDWVTIESVTGAATARLWLTDRAIPRVVFLPEHYGFLSDLQGGSATQQEPEGLAHRITSCDRVAGGDSPAGLMVAVSVRKAMRRDMRQRGV